MDETMTPIQAYIENARDGNIGGFTIPLPTTAEKLRPWLEAIETDGSGGDIVIKDVRSSIPGLEEALKGIVPIDGAGDILDGLNCLAAKIQAMGPSDMEVFLAALEAERHLGSVDELISLPDNLGNFELQPAFSAKQYGEFLLEAAKDNTSPAFERLEKSDNPEDRALAAHILDLEEHVDPEYYGRHARDNEQGVFTDKGYLTERGEFKAIYHGTADIPKEYRLFALEPAFPAIRDAGILPFLLKLHATAGEYSRDIKHNFDTLTGLRSSEYLLLLDGKSAYLTGASHAYRQGSDAFGHWMDTPLSPNTQAFAIHLTEVHGEIRGDVERIDFGERQMDIFNHGIKPIKIEAEMEDGEMRSYTPEEWESLSLLEKDRVQSWRREFQAEDYAKVHKHLDEIGGLPESARGINADAFFETLNAAYMEKSMHPAVGFLRVNQEAAKEMLASGDADVYRLLPSGAEKLSPIDAVKSGLWFSEYREFAVRREDLPKLDKWAERAAAKLARQAGRDEQTKQSGLEV